jgi:hypothetical protein
MNKKLIVFLTALSFFFVTTLAQAEPRYFAFQIFTGVSESDAMRRSLPLSPSDLHQTIIDLRNRIGTDGANGEHRLGFILGPSPSTILMPRHETSLPRGLILPLKQASPSVFTSMIPCSEVVSRN